MCLLQYYYNSSGKKFRSRSDVGKHLGLEEDKKKKTGITREAALAGEGDPPAKQELPLELGKGVTVVRCGSILNHLRCCTFQTRVLL
jgi:hypothetical protein